jgi:hypothetical protein
VATSSEKKQIRGCGVGKVGYLRRALRARTFFVFERLRGLAGFFDFHLFFFVGVVFGSFEIRVWERGVGRMYYVLQCKPVVNPSLRHSATNLTKEIIIKVRFQNVHLNCLMIKGFM